jgi:methyl-accepting chemotaxis protein
MTQLALVNKWRKIVTKFPLLEQRDSQLAKNLDDAYKEARRLGAVEGARRIELAGNQFANLSFEQAYNIINPPTTLREAEEAQTKLVRIFYVIRNALALVPLILTWFALWQAASDYQSDLALHPDDVYQPFLKLWQENFHGIGHLVFSTAALIDVIVLTVYGLGLLGLPLWEWYIRQKMATFSTNLQNVTRDLMVTVAQVGSASLLSDDDITRLSDAIRRAVELAMLSGKQMAEDAKTFIRSTQQQVQTIIDNFHRDLATFNANTLEFSQDLKTLETNLQSYDQKLLDLTDASKQLAGSSSVLATNAQTMADSATKSAQASQDAMKVSQNIGTQLGALNTTQQNMVGEIASKQQEVVDKVEAAQQQMLKDLASTQQQIAGNFDNAADKMEEVAKDTKQVAKDLGQVTQADIKRITNEIMQLSYNTQTNIQKITSRVDQLTTRLETVDRQLQGTTDALRKAADNFVQVSSKQAASNKKGGILGFLGL